MPYSSDENVAAIHEWLKEWAPQDSPHAARVKVRFLDVGAGAGLNRDRLADLFPVSRDHWTALEIWEPYVERFGLRDRYDEVLVGDVRNPPELDENYLPHVILLGDVLEHMTRDEAVSVWNWARDTVGDFGMVIASLPIVHYPQGEVDGNPYEAHLHHYTVDEFWQTFPGVQSESTGEVTGAFMAYGTKDER